jgi:hypothetical protein
MPTPIGAGYARVLHSLLQASDPEAMAVTYGIQLEGGAGAPNEGDVADGLHAAFAGNAMSAMRGAYSLAATRVTFGGPDQGNLSQAFAGGVVVGNADEALPQNTAYLIKKRSGIAGRRFQGRMYLPGVRESVVSSGGILDSTWQAAVQGFMNQWLTAIEGVGGVIRMVILHTAPTIGPALNPTPVINLEVDRLVATQRQRLRR